MADAAGGVTLTRIPIDTIQAQISAVLSAWGMPADIVQVTADIMAETDLRGIDSHGIAMLPLYAQQRGLGKIVMAPAITVVKQGPVTGLIDGGGGLGHAPAAQAMQLAITMAQAMGLGAVTVSHSNHFGAAGAYALMAARAGLIGMAMTNAGGRIIVPTRAKEPVFGTNPIAFAAPRAAGRPFVLDMATSTVAVGKVKLAHYNNRTMPEGWASAPDGSTITDPALAFDGHGRLKPSFGLSPLGAQPELSSHKGYGLAAMVEILTSMLSGAPFIGVLGDHSQHQTGHFFLAMDPGCFREDGAFEAELDGMVAMLHGLEPNDPALPVRVAGEPEDLAAAERSAAGVPMPDMLLDQLKEICRDCNVPYLL